MRSRSLWVLCVLAVGAGFSGCSLVGQRTPDFEFTGTVYDDVTRQPIDGAYVMASYREDVGVRTACFKTRGMYTGKDGKYHFPIDRLDGQSPWITIAIKPDYYFKSFDVPSREVWNRQDASSYADRNIYLAPQDPKNPTQKIGSLEADCIRARNREDAAAGAKFLRIELEERAKYGASKEAQDAIAGMIQTLEKKPPKDEGAVRPQSPK